MATQYKDLILPDDADNVSLTILNNAFKTLADDIEVNANQISSVAEIFTAEYDVTKAAGYKIGDYCIYNNILYKCTTDTATPAGAWDSSKWTEVKALELLNSLIREVYYDSSTGKYYTSSSKTNEITDSPLLMIASLNDDDYKGALFVKTPPGYINWQTEYATRVELNRRTEGVPILGYYKSDSDEFYEDYPYTTKMTPVAYRLYFDKLEYKLYSYNGTSGTFVQV